MDYVQDMKSRPHPLTHKDRDWTVIVCRAKPPYEGEERITVSESFDSPEAAATYLKVFHDRLEYIEHRPWTKEEDAHRILRPMPRQFTKFYVPTPDVWRPDPKKISVVIQSKPVQGRNLLADLKPISGKSLI